MGVSTSVMGLKTTQGVIALVAALLCAGLTWAESSGTLAWDKATSLLLAAAAAILGAGAALYGIFQGGGPVGLSAGVFLAVIAAGALCSFAIQRVQACNRLRQGPPSATPHG